MTATDKLLPCPFCGGKAEFRSGSSTTPYIRCKECGGRTKSSYDKAKLVDAWNRRAENAKLRELMWDLWEFGCGPNSGANSAAEWAEMADDLHDRMTELEIEVDA